MIEIDPKIKALLKKRGIETEEELEEFFSDRPKETYDPFLLPDMEEGVDLILSSIEEGKKICIYGDYDADGVTSTVILTEVLKQLTPDIIQYIPSRFDEGYGLNKSAIDTIKENGAGLIVTVDCGSVSVDEVEYAKEIGLDIMVTDHHQVTDRMADTILINPARPDSEYPFSYLAGCGVAFKLAQAITDVAGLPRETLTSEMDLVAIGTVGDIVPLISENRMLTKYGLRLINTGRRKALKILIEKTGFTLGKITADNISFGIAPHINAAGRMKSAATALRLFLAEDEQTMEKYAEELVRLNTERKTLQGEVYKKASEEVEERFAGKSFIMVDLEHAHEGVTGIAAGKLKETYHVPSIIVTDTEDGKLKGTGRSPEGINLYELLKNEEDHFITFGGHAAACGFTMEKDDLEEVRDKLSSIAEELKKERPDLFEYSVKADMTLSAEDVTEEFADQIEMMAPFGRMNERPKVEVKGRAFGMSRMGKDGSFLRFDLDLGAGRVRCLVFRDVDEIESIAGSHQDDRDLVVTGCLSINEWNGNRYVQLEVKSAR